WRTRWNKGRIKTVLRYLLSQGALRRVSGSGASGSFRLQRGGGAPKAGKRKTAAAKRRKSWAKTGTAAPGPNDPSGEIKPAAARPKRVSRSPGKIRGTVATRRKQILEDIIKGTFLMERGLRPGAKNENKTVLFRTTPPGSSKERMSLLSGAILYNAAFLEIRRCVCVVCIHRIESKLQGYH
ncbi:hypothetical protein G0U57_021389, partial [Chelydra serpentina]